MCNEKAEIISQEKGILHLALPLCINYLGRKVVLESSKLRLM